MIADMGVEPGMAEPRLSARSRFRSAAFVVIAAARMQSMASEWKQAQKLGEGLRKAKSEVLKRRETARKSSASSMRVD